MSPISDPDGLLAQLGVTIEPPAPKVVKAERRFTEWSNAHSFVDGGYIAQVVQTTCENCGSMRENLEGVFSVEIKVSTGARRLTALGRGFQVPQKGGHKCEVRQAFTRWCPDCIRGLGFDREVESEATPLDMVKGE